jgi:hypothetical protein
LERGSDEEAIGGEPLHEGSGDFLVDGRDGVEGGGVVCDVESVGRVELVCAGRDGDLDVNCQRVEHDIKQYGRDSPCDPSKHRRI